jgi:parallel beta-helix repeat protein
MYGNQEGKDVKMATLNRLIYNNGHDHIHIRDLKLTGSISHAIHLNSSAHYNRIQDCDISYAGGSAIEDYGGNFLEAHYNNIIHSNYGIYCTGSDSRITNNDIAYIGMINGSAFMPHATGIYISSTNITVEYNTIQYTEWSGINTSSASTYSIYRNFINYPCMLIDDGGGIYSTSSQGTRTISQNIVLNSGVGSEDWLIIPRGIYYDAGGSGASITNNIVAGCKGGGLLIHYGDNHTITGNLLFNNEQQAEFLKWGTGVSTGITFNNNILIAKTATQRSLRSLSYTTDEIKAWGNFDYNYYARPIDDDNHFYYASGYHTLAEWKALVTPDDAHSYGSPVSVSSTNDIHFIYNNTKAVKYWTLSASMVDITNASYSGEISLQPFTGLVLLGVGTVTESGGEPPAAVSGFGKVGTKFGKYNGKLAGYNN